MYQRLKMVGGALLAFALLFGIPAILVRTSMQDVPERSRVKVMTVYEDAIDYVDSTYARHRTSNHPGRLMAVPDNAHDWIEAINPMGRKAPGGGPALLLLPNGQTGAVGLSGDQTSVTITLPAYRHLKPVHTIITARSGISRNSFVISEQEP
jgi:hypothetical protein